VLIVNYVKFNYYDRVGFVEYSIDVSISIGLYFVVINITLPQKIVTMLQNLIT